MQMRPQVITRSLNGFIGCIYRSSKEPVVLDMGIIESLIAIMEFLHSENEITGMYGNRNLFSNLFLIFVFCFCSLH